MIFVDEHLISFLFRLQIVNGHFDFSNMFSLKGRLKPIITVPKDILKIFRKYDESRLYYAFFTFPGNDKIVWGTENLRERPFGRLLVTGEISLPEYNKTSVYYCLDCVRESLINNGVGYLRQQWTGAGRCAVHKKPLTLMEYPTRSGMVDALSDLLIFGIPSFGYEGSDNIVNPDEKTRKLSENHRVNDAYVVGYPNEAKSRYVYIKRCAEKKLSDWLRFHRGVISEKYYLRPGYYNPAQMAETLLTKPGAHLPRLYEELINNPHYDFKVYAEKLTEFCTEFIGIFNQTSIPIKVLKAVDARCHFCPTGSDARTCRVNGSLAWFYLMTPILKEESNGTEFIFSGSREELNEYLFGIYRKYCPFDRQGHPLSGVSIIDWASADACFPVQKTDMGNEKEEQSPVTGKGNKQSGMTPEPSLYREQKYLRHQVVLLRKQNALLTNLLEAKNDK